MEEGLRRERRPGCDRWVGFCAKPRRLRRRYDPASKVDETLVEFSQLHLLLCCSSRRFASCQILCAAVAVYPFDLMPQVPFLSFSAFSGRVSVDPDVPFVDVTSFYYRHLREGREKSRGKPPPGLFHSLTSHGCPAPNF